MSKTVRTLAAAGFVFASTFPAAAQDASIRTRQGADRAGAGAAGQPRRRPPAPAQTNGATFTTPGPRVDLAIEDAVARGMDKNIDIAVARITPRLTDFTHRRARGELSRQPDVDGEQHEAHHAADADDPGHLAADNAARARLVSGHRAEPVEAAATTPSTGRTAV